MVPTGARERKEGARVPWTSSPQGQQPSGDLCLQVCLPPTQGAHIPAPKTAETSRTERSGLAPGPPHSPAVSQRSCLHGMTCPLHHTPNWEFLLALNGSQQPSAEKAKRKHTHDLTLQRHEGRPATRQRRARRRQGAGERRVRQFTDSARSTGGGDREPKDAVAGAGGRCLLQSEATP